MRKTAAALTIILLITAAAGTMHANLGTANPYIRPIPETLATEHGYIRSNGTVDPSTLPIEREGNFYRLTDNILNYTFQMQRDNIVIDGNNFSLSFPTYGEVDTNNLTKTSPALISISNRTNVMVKNIIFDKYSNAIAIQNSSNIIILQNTIRDGNSGIYINNSTNCSIVANQITNHTLHAISIRDSTSFNVSYNTISNSRDSGIAVTRMLQPIDSLQNSIFTRNTFSEDNFALTFLGVHAANNHIFENNFLNNQYCGIAFLGVKYTNNSIHDNYWIGNPVQIINHTDSEQVQDTSPLPNPISTYFNSSLFALPEFAQSPTPKQSISDSLLTTLVPISIVMIVIIYTGLMLYFKKHKRNLVQKP